jgi:hypothetical protein
MEMQSRYVNSKANLGDRYAEASRARLAKGDGVSDGRPVIVTGSTSSPTLAGLRARLGGLRGLGRRTAPAPAASSAG